MSVSYLPWLILALILGTAGISALTTCLASLIVNIRYRQLGKAAFLAQTPITFLVLRTLASSFLGAAYALLTFCPCAGHGLRPKPRHAPSQPPVVCIHGLYQNRRAWFFYQRWLRRAGFSNLYTWSYPSFGQDFDALSRALHRDLQELAQNSPERRIILIGHSLGGLLIKSVLTDPEAAEGIGLVVTLGTPHQGSVLAGLAVGRLGRSLQFKASLVTSLARLSQPSGPAKVSIYPPLDNMVAPISGLRPVESGWQEIQTPPLGHISLLLHRQTARRVAMLAAESG